MLLVLPDLNKTATEDNVTPLHSAFHYDSCSVIWSIDYGVLLMKLSHPILGNNASYPAGAVEEKHKGTMNTFLCKNA